MAKLKLGFPAFRCVSSVISGQGALKGLNSLDFDKTLFFLSAQPAVRDLLVQSIESIGDLAELSHITKPPGEPSLNSIRSSLGKYFSTAPNNVVVVGGGSTLDWARLVVLAATVETELVGNLPSQRLPPPRKILVPTTPATGAESGSVAVYQDDFGTKKAVVDSNLMADEVILDERVLQHCDPQQIALWLSDALSHGVEALQSIISLPLAEHAAKTGLNLIFENDPTDPKKGYSLSRLLEASHLAGNAATHCSVGIAHAFAHALGQAGFSHALCNAVALTPAIHLNASKGNLQKALSSMRIDQRTFNNKIQAITRFGATRDKIALANLLQYLQEQPNEEVVAAMRADVSSRSNPIRVTEVVGFDFINRVKTQVNAWLVS